MDYDDLTLLQRHHPAWRLLRADNAPLVLGFLGPVFVEDNTRSLPAVELESRLDDELYGLNAGAGATDDPPYPRSARAYLDEWCGPEHGWLRRFYPPDSDDPYVEATPALESAYAWVRGLRGREFVGTESRLHTVVDLLRQMVYGAETDPEARLTELHRRRAILDGEIAAAERGEVDVLDDVFGESVRLEQERIAWPHVESALDRALHSTRRCTRPGATDAGTTQRIMSDGSERGTAGRP